MPLIGIEGIAPSIVEEFKNALIIALMRKLQQSKITIPTHQIDNVDGVVIKITTNISDSSFTLTLVEPATEKSHVLT